MDAKVPNYTGWQSDVIVDMIKRYGFPFITLNPGASFRRRLRRRPERW